jgi:hypothetical protein
MDVARRSVGQGVGCIYPCTAANPAIALRLPATRLLWLAEEFVQKPSEMIGTKGMTIKGLVRAGEDV